MAARESGLHARSGLGGAEPDIFTHDLGLRGRFRWGGRLGRRRSRM